MGGMGSRITMRGWNTMDWMLSGEFFFLFLFGGEGLIVIIIFVVVVVCMGVKGNNAVCMERKGQWHMMHATQCYASYQQEHAIFNLGPTGYLEKSNMLNNHAVKPWACFQSEDELASR